MKAKTMKLTYWVARVKNDAPCYHIRARTKTECLERMKEYGQGWQDNYEQPQKVTTEYGSAFELMHNCLYGEDRAWWEGF